MWQTPANVPQNFGDALSPTIVQKLLRSTAVEQSDLRHAELVAIGSLMDYIEKYLPPRKDKLAVWGTGYIADGPLMTQENREKMTFLAVRGDLTRQRISLPSSIAVGDPALLANRFFPAGKPNGKIGIVPHYVYLYDQNIASLQNNEAYTVISPLGDPKEIIERITACDVIVSSSLHGLIIADSFGIPNLYCPMGNKVTGGDYKFLDYFSITGRDFIKITIEDMMNKEEIRAIASGWKPVVGLSVLQQNLEKALYSHMGMI